MEYEVQAGFSSDSITLWSLLVQTSTENVNPCLLMSLKSVTAFPLSMLCSLLSIPSMLPTASEVSNVWGWGGGSREENLLRSLRLQYFFSVLFAFNWCFSRTWWGELASVPAYALHNVLLRTCALLEVSRQDQSKVIEFHGALINYHLEYSTNIEYSTLSVSSSFLQFLGKKRHWFYLEP